MHPPTPRRLRLAREAGDGGASAAANRACALAVLVLLLPSLGRALGDEFRSSLGSALAHPERASMASTANAVLSLSLPMVAALWAVVAVALVVQLGGVVARRSRTDVPRRTPGLALRLYDAFRGVTTAVAMMGVVLAVLAHEAPSLADAVGSSVLVPISASGAARRVLLGALVLLVSFAAVDVAVKQAAFRARWRMTRREADLERRELEGDPALRAARRRAYDAPAAR